MNRLGEKGYALIYVLWVSALIAVIAAGLVTRVRTNALVASNIDKSDKTEAIADGVARLLALRLSERRDYPGNGTFASCDYDGSHVEFAVQDQAGLIDLNTAPDFLLVELFSRLGLNAEASRHLTDAIFDFRDPDQTSRGGGPEPTIYEGRSYGPKNAPFEAVEELDQIPGITDQYYRRLIDLVTVNSFEVGIDPDAAPSELRHLFEQAPSGDFSGMLAAFVSRSQKRAFGLDVRVTSASGGRFRRKALVFITGQPTRPFSFLEWRRGADWAEQTNQPTQSCFTL